MLTAITVNAQWSPWASSRSSYGKYTHQSNGDTVALSVWLMNSTIPVTQSGTWNINNITGTVSLPTGASTEATLASILANQTNGTQTTQLTGSSNNYSTSFSTAGTVIDSVTLGFTSRVVTFINDGVATDTLFVSTSSSFPSTNRLVRVGGEGFTKQWAVTKLYFKVGSTPLASKKIRIEAN